MKTNVKTSRISPAFAFITADEFSLQYQHGNQNRVIDSRIALPGASHCTENKISSLLSQIQLDSDRLIIILSAELTLFSEQVFPSGLSDPQIGELLELQLSKRASSAEISTFYDYFLLKRNKESSLYGLIEARKDLINRWISCFKNSGLKTVAILSEPIVLLNYILKYKATDTGSYRIVCMLNSRIYIGCVEGNHLVQLKEQMAQVESLPAASLAALVKNQLDAGDHALTMPLVIVDAVDCGVAQVLADDLDDTDHLFKNLSLQQTLGENLINWLRKNDDTYQSVAMA